MVFLATALLASTLLAVNAEKPTPVRHKRAAAHNHAARAEGDPYPTGPAYDIPPLAEITPLPAEYNENLPTLPETFPAGAQPSAAGFPPLPDFTFDPAEWPTEFNTVPSVDSPQVIEWLRELEGHDIPDIPVNPTVVCSDPENAQALANAGRDGNCWWSCGGCTREEDISTCQNQWEYGLTFDDGPYLYTPRLLRYLDAERIKATFFVVGARVIAYPEILQYEHMLGHEIASHTWSHNALTTLTNAEVVAELGWTREAIRRTTGLSPIMMRPPYGDIDDRVRAISIAMGMIPVLWTEVTDEATGVQTLWDSNDFRVHDPASDVEAVENQREFEAVLDSSGQFDHGVVVLHHDVYTETVDLAVGYSLPYILQHNPPFDVKPVMVCQGRPIGDAYVETNTNGDSPVTPPNSSNTRSGTGTSTGSQTEQTGSSAFAQYQTSSVGGLVLALAGVVAGAMLV